MGPWRNDKKKCIDFSGHLNCTGNEYLLYCNSIITFGLFHIIFWYVFYTHICICVTYVLYVSSKHVWICVLYVYVNITVLNISKTCFFKHVFSKYV